jgi:hypothetical protein
MFPLALASCDLPTIVLMKQETHLNDKSLTVLPKEIPNDSRGVEHVE